MNALTQTFDSLGYFEKLKDAGVPEPQARVQAEALRQQTEAQRVALRQELDRYDEASRRELATRGDIQDVRGEIQEVRGEIQEVRLEIEKVKASIKDTELRLLKWQFGIGLALAAVMAKGFGWLGF